jgi:hypothetical protein
MFNAYNPEQEEQQKRQQADSMLTGNSGSISLGGQRAGSGFTNLQQYLTANQGSGSGLAGDITSQGQAEVDKNRASADAMGNAFVDNKLSGINHDADNIIGQVNNARSSLESDPYNTNPAEQAKTLAYNNPGEAKNMAGANDLDKAYQNVKNSVSNFAADHETQKAGLQKKYGYGAGFAGLDAFLGRQDGGKQIQDWASGVDTGSAKGVFDKVDNASGLAKSRIDRAQGDLRSGMDKAAATRKQNEDDLAKARDDWHKRRLNGMA